MTRHRFVLPLLLFMVLALLPATARSQDLSVFWEFTPKPGNGAGFEAAIKDHVAYRESQGDPWDWQVYQVAVGDEIGKYYVASWNHAWADIDAYEAWDGAAACEAHFEATISPLLEEVSHSYSESNRDFERMPPDPTAVNLVNVTTFYLIPGKQAQFNDALGRVQQAILEADMPLYYSSDYPVAGGSGPAFSIAMFGRNWADFADPDPNMEQVLVQKYGEEGAMQLFTDLSESFRYTENMVVRFRPDLSSPAGM